jgi:hypothetical protein
MIGIDAWRKIYLLFTNKSPRTSDVAPHFKAFSGTKIDRLVIYTVLSTIEFWFEKVYDFPNKNFRGAGTLINNFRKLDWDKFIYEFVESIEEYKNNFETKVSKKGLKIFEDWFNQNRNKEMIPELKIEGFKNDSATKSNYKRSSQQSRSDAEKEFWDAELS